MKKRHIKTFEEKYGLRSVYDECVDMMIKMQKKGIDDPEKVFAKLPYLGYLYIPINGKNHRWWYYTERTDRIRAKVLEVDRWGHVKLAHIDDHHDRVVTIETPSNEFDTHRVKGNVLIHIDEIDENV